MSVEALHSSNSAKQNSSDNATSRMMEQKFVKLALIIQIGPHPFCLALSVKLFNHITICNLLLLLILISSTTSLHVVV